MKIFFLLLFAIFQPEATDPHEQTVSQVEHYISQIQAGQNVSQNSWALHETAILNCTTLKIVQDRIYRLPAYISYYESIECENILNGDVSSLNTQFWAAELTTQYNSILESNRLVDVAQLDYKDSPLIHFNLIMSGNFSTVYSTEYLVQALKIWRQELSYLESSNSLEYSLLLSITIRAAYILDDYKTLNSLYEDFLNQDLLPNTMHKLRLLGAFDYTFYLYGNYHKSLDLQRHYSLPLASFIGTNRDIRSIQNRQGAYLFSLGKYEESKKIYEQLYNTSKPFEDQSTLFNNLSVNYLKLGQSNKYLSFQLKALEQEIDDHKSLLSIYRNLFIYYTTVGDIQSALGYIEKSKDLAEANDDRTELALIDFSLAIHYWKAYKDSEKALEYLESAKKILTPEQNFGKYTDLLIEEGTIYLAVGDLERSEKLYLELKTLSTKTSNTALYVEAIVNLTAIELKRNNFKKASAFLDEIKLYPLDDLDFQLLTKYYTVKAQNFYETGFMRKAIKDLKPIIEQIVDRTQSNSDSQEGYWSVEQEYLDAFALMTDMLIESGAEGQALIMLDKLKTINDASLYNSPLVKASKLSEEDLAEEKRLNDQLQVLRKKYLNATEEERFSLKNKIDQTSAVREQILSKVNLDKGASLPPLWAIQNTIENDELILHFTEISGKLYITYLRADNIQIKQVDFSSANKERFTFIADDLASGTTNLNELYEIYKYLDLGEIPADVNQITVIPESYLYRIPLEILPSRQPNSPVSYGSAHYLIEDYHFRYFTSLKEFEHNKRINESKAAHDFSGFAISDFNSFKGNSLPSLPYATVETRDVQSVLTSLQDRSIYTERDATKAKFKEQVGQSRLVHVATHSEVSEQDPLFSTIYLMNTDAEDSLDSEQALYAYELFDTPLNSEFIMLNSCSSGSGNYIQGSGVMGISRALRYAGAKSLALNLWSVNDKVASEFATDFYTYLNEGDTKSEAIRKAKLNQLRTANANPHFWGAYMMIGNPSPITNKQDNAWLLFSFLMATTLLSGINVYRNNKA